MIARALALAVLLLSSLAHPGAADPWDEPALRDDTPATLSELVHGSDEVHDLRGRGGQADEDWFRVHQAPYSSYEVVVDGVAGDLVPIEVLLVAADGTTTLGSAAPIGVGTARSLRFVNDTDAAVDDQLVVVRSGGCTGKCKKGDVYRVRFYETTYACPRFNNTGTQVTVLVVQNPGTASVAGNVRFWDATGALIGTSAFSLAAKAELVLQTSAVAPAVSGSITLSHDGRYGELAGKAIALEPATGFSFDTPLLHRPH